MLLGDIKIRMIDGSEIHMSEFAGKVLAIVNVASKCGFTPQYAGLEALYQQYKDKGLIVLGVPCNQFGGQEPGSEEEIQQFCQSRFGVTFPMTAKVNVNGPQRHPLYQWLVERATDDAGDVQWNFEKFLVGRETQLLGRFRSLIKPEDPEFLQKLEAAL